MWSAPARRALLRRRPGNLLGAGVVSSVVLVGRTLDLSPLPFLVLGAPRLLASGLARPIRGATATTAVVTARASDGLRRGAAPQAGAALFLDAAIPGGQARTAKLWRRDCSPAVDWPRSEPPRASRPRRGARTPRRPGEPLTASVATSPCPPLTAPRRGRRPAARPGRVHQLRRSGGHRHRRPADEGRAAPQQFPDRRPAVGLLLDLYARPVAGRSPWPSGAGRLSRARPGAADLGVGHGPHRPRRRPSSVLLALRLVLGAGRERLLPVQLETAGRRLCPRTGWGRPTA